VSFVGERQTRQAQHHSGCTHITNCKLDLSSDKAKSAPLERFFIASEARLKSTAFRYHQPKNKDFSALTPLQLQAPATQIRMNASAGFTAKVHIDALAAIDGGSNTKAP
jgi:hypothetical protein